MVVTRTGFFPCPPGALKRVPGYFAQAVSAGSRAMVGNPLPTRTAGHRGSGAPSASQI